MNFVKIWKDGYIKRVISKEGWRREFSVWTTQSHVWEGYRIYDTYGDMMRLTMTLLVTS